MADDLDLLYRAMINNPEEDTPLLMLIDEYRERGMDWFVTVFEVELAERRRHPNGISGVRAAVDAILALGPDGVERVIKAATEDALT